MEKSSVLFGLALFFALLSNMMAGAVAFEGTKSIAYILGGIIAMLAGAALAAAIFMRGAGR